MLTESDVIAAVCLFLEENRFQVAQRLREKERGIDIRASTPDGRQVAIEAKGETSSMAHTARYGKAFSGAQVFDHVAKAIYCAAGYISKGVLGGVALPRNANHLKQVELVDTALKRLGIEVFWVSADGKVDVAGNWSCW